VEARIALATALLDAGRPGEAAQVVVVGIDRGIDAGEPALQAVLGRALEAAGDPSGAVLAYARALNRDPHNIRIAYRMTKRLLASRSYVLAASYIYLRFPTLRFAYPDLKLDLGLAFYRFGFLDQAKANLEGFPYSGAAAVYLGHIARKRDHKKEAIRQYRYAFNLDPIQHTEALLHIVEIHRKDFHLREALKVINEYLKLKPQDAKAQATRARILQDLFRKPKALQQWIKVLQLDPRNADAFIQCIRLYREQGKEDDARRMTEILKSLNLSLTPKQERELEKECLMLGVERPKKKK
jgi:tetratricopeptide (TPR) repeat protein